jgi:hypothetical protein
MSDAAAEAQQGLHDVRVRAETYSPGPNLRDCALEAPSLPFAPRSLIDTGLQHMHRLGSKYVTHVTFSALTLGCTAEMSIIAKLARRTRLSHNTIHAFRNTAVFSTTLFCLLREPSAVRAETRRPNDLEVLQGTKIAVQAHRHRHDRMELPPKPKTAYFMFMDDARGRPEFAGVCWWPSAH